MINVTLPDGSIKSFDSSLSVGAIARSIAPSLGKAAVAGRLNGQLVDLGHSVSEDAELAIITGSDVEGLEVIRHSTAHLLAHAVKVLYPAAQVTIGPVIDDGFYYDFSFDRAFTPEDLTAIEKKMKQLAKKDLRIERSVQERDQASQYFQSIGETYKSEIIQDLPEAEELSLYTQGDFTDLCRGPHVSSTAKLKVFKLLKVAGAYWRGDSNNAMLQRIYGTAWATQDALDAHLFKLEEAEKRDHRKLGKQLDLFHSQEEAPGMVFWRPKGWELWQQVEQYMRHVYKDNGYQEVKCPQILDVSLWKKSGHWDNFRDNMFFTASENREYAVKPMNCPGHVQIFNSGLRSYRDLPVRYGEFGGCHRNEPSGALHGLMRVRAFTQDDGHIFCTAQQVEEEVQNFHKLAIKTYSDFDFSDVTIKLALRPDQRLGDDSVWDNAEAALRGALRSCDVQWEELPGEGAFYGPKIEYHLKDSIGRSWQCGTIQVDFMMPQRLG
ncbi:MAG: threonine--tRNA ligase, partial [Betaproteobacteria bacterium]|nr:threonine--tRNA ligase [Betaproteobacteria bacterium]